MAEEIKRVEPIMITDPESGLTYTLEFNRESVTFAERQGFVIDKIDTALMSTLTDLFHYSFRMHHKGITRQQTEDILYNKLGGFPDGMVERLTELYALPYNSLVQVDKGEEESKNTHWTVKM